MASITIEGVSKLFGRIRAVDDVSLKIAQGELFFLLGPSGCGKTTLLRTLAGFYRPDRGRVLFDANDVTDVPPHQRNAAMVFQNYALWPHMSVRENLTFGLEMHAVSPAERARRVERALDMVQMGELAQRMPNQLSGGQQQRVAVARALVLEPEVVLMDEPLANLDAKLRLEMRQQIKRIHEQLGLTMVYVTHDQAEALSMADRIAVIVEGRVIQVGRPREIYNRPANRTVADFIGEANLLTGRLTSLGPPASVETAVGKLVSSVVYRGAAAGDAVWCSLRPERLNVLANGESRPNELTGDVLGVVYLGNHEQYFLRLADGSELKAIEWDIEAPKAEAGQPARVGCEPSDVVVLRGE